MKLLNVVGTSEGRECQDRRWGIVKSFGGPLAASPGKNAWATDAPATVMVVHVFKSLDDKAKFDQMFDPTAPFFKDLIDSG